MLPIPFSPPFIDEDVIHEVTDTLRSGWITTGPKVKALEHEVTKMNNVEASICVNSWTSGAILILKWFGVGAGDEVIIPAYTYSATALAVLHCGATPVMVDINEDFTVDPEQIKRAITRKTKIIIPVDVAGLPCDYNAINELVHDRAVKSLFVAANETQEKLGRILVLSDAAHSLGAFYNGEPIGRATDIVIFSFHAVKNVTTAEGGAICINLPAPFDNFAVYAHLRLWTLNGQSKDAFTKAQLGGWKYDILFQGLKVNMPDLCAALGLAQIRKYDMILKERKRIADYYHHYFSQYEWADVPVIKDETRNSSYHLYPLSIKGITEEERDQIIEHITEMGVAVNVHFIPMPMLTLFKGLGYDIDDYPVAYKKYAGEISLPIYPQLKDDALNYICKAIVKSYESIPKEIYD